MQEFFLGYIILGLVPENNVIHHMFLDHCNEGHLGICTVILTYREHDKAGQWTYYMSGKNFQELSFSW
jgi:hypothetical protein